jgi:hypothetical protein
MKAEHRLNARARESIGSSYLPHPIRVRRSQLLFGAR